VGRVEQVVLHPMNFEEFLLATGKTALHKRLSTCDFSDITYPVFYKEFCNYIVIGGMPEAINQYLIPC
jgi:predicted AAA+ superfamily ATPase